MLSDDEQTALFRDTFESLAFRNAPGRAVLFDYLWKRRSQLSYGADIWKEGLKETAAYNPARKSHSDRVRWRCFDLHNALTDRFRGIPEGWRIGLPIGGPKHGYQLEIKAIRSEESASRAFWEAHLSPASKVALIYTEQLFYQDWPKHFIFRYYHLNAENEAQALTDLQIRHPESYKKTLTIAHPYVSCGEVDARDLIVNWFAEKAHEKVKVAVTRRMDDREIAECSLILLRSPVSNRMVKDILDAPSSRHLNFSLSQVVVDERCYGRITVKNPTAEERQRFEPYKPQDCGAECCTLDYSPEQGVVLGILSRVRSPYADTAVTIFNADIGRPLGFMAHLLTMEEGRLRELGKQIGWPVPLPRSFEVLFAVPIGPIRKDYMPAKLEPLAWRAY